MNSAITALSNPFSVNSASTPSALILFNLSKEIHTLSNWSSSNPTDKRISRKILLSLIFTLKLLIPILRRAFAVVWINSISQVEESDPRISHWINSLKRPFCGRSARYTLSI